MEDKEWKIVVAGEDDGVGVAHNRNSDRVQRSPGHNLVVCIKIF